MKQLGILVLLACVLGVRVLTGSFYGRILDQTGAGVPATSIPVVNEATGFRWQVEAGSDGRYRIADLPPGASDVAALKHGFDVHRRLRDGFAGNMPSVRSAHWRLNF